MPLMLKYIHKFIKTKRKQTKEMDSTTNTVEPVTLNEVLQLASWDRPRSDKEIQDFISRREAAIGGLGE